MSRRMHRLGLALAAMSMLAALTWLILPFEVALDLGMSQARVPTLLVVAAFFTLGALTGALTFRRVGGGGHDPRLLLPRLLGKKVRHAIDDGYRSGELENALDVVERELDAAPNSLGLQYWRIRLLLDTGRSDKARGELVRLLPLLPEVALTLRWSALYEAGGEQEAWIRNVLERIRDGQIVRRSTFRELVRLLQASNRFDEGLEVLQRLRAFDPPAPEEETELTETEMVLRIRLAKQLGDEGKFDAAMREVKRVRERFSGWSAPYQIGVRCLKSQGDATGAANLALTGFRNTGQPDLLLTAYDLQIQTLTPVELLAQWDDALSDLSDDGWYALTTGWIAFRHGIVEEGVKRLQEVASDDPAYAHAQIILGGMNVERGHVSDGSAMLVRGNWPWMQIPFVWSCGVCGQLERSAPVNCNQCGSFQSYRMVRPYTVEEPAVARLVTAYVLDRS